MGWFLMAWMRAVEFSGRSRRKEYWMFTLINSIVVLCAVLAVPLISSSGWTSPMRIVLWAYLWISMLPSLSVTVRRLHDVDKSGWWYFVSFVPLIGAIYLLILMCTDGDSGWNRFGASPK
jgi:uncharacterized membrane protein YhaH (DUF805 family)